MVATRRGTRVGPEEGEATGADSGQAENVGMTEANTQSQKRMEPQSEEQLESGIEDQDVSKAHKSTPQTVTRSRRRSGQSDGEVSEADSTSSSHSLRMTRSRQSLTRLTDSSRTMRSSRSIVVTDPILELKEDVELSEAESFCSSVSARDTRRRSTRLKTSVSQTLAEGPAVIEISDSESNCSSASGVMSRRTRSSRIQARQVKCPPPPPAQIEEVSDAESCSSGISENPVARRIRQGMRSTTQQGDDGISVETPTKENPKLESPKKQRNSRSGVVPVVLERSAFEAEENIFSPRRSLRTRQREYVYISNEGVDATASSTIPEVLPSSIRDSQEPLDMPNVEQDSASVSNEVIDLEQEETSSTNKEPKKQSCELMDLEKGSKQPSRTNKETDDLSEERIDLEEEPEEPSKELAKVTEELINLEEEPAEPSKELANVAKELIDLEEEPAEPSKELANVTEELIDIEEEPAELSKELANVTEELMDLEQEAVNSNNTSKSLTSPLMSDRVDIDSQVLEGPSHKLNRESPGKGSGSSNSQSSRPNIDLYLDSDESEDSQDSDDAEVTTDDEEMEEETENAIGTRRSKERPLEDALDDGLFVIDTVPGLDPSKTYYMDHKKDAAKSGDEERGEEEESDDDFIDEDEEEEDEENDLLNRPNPALKLSSSIKTGLNIKDLGGLCINFDGEKPNPRPSLEKKMKKDHSKIEEVLKKSVITPDIEKKESIKPYKESANQLKKQRKEEREKTTGHGWFDMKAPEMTEDLKNDLKALKMRAAMDPKRFYKKNDRDGFPKYFQVGTVVDTPLDFYHSRIPKKQRKRTIVEELLADSEFRRYNKKKYREVMAEKAAIAEGKKKRKTKKFRK
uniref:Fcf2 pre-rRNA processing C-terminal domain-containing protein n=2 Tax=Xenopus tropicalis TaxID=8364 RepID=A0A6I8RNX7_XENTR